MFSFENSSGTSRRSIAAILLASIWATSATAQEAVEASATAEAATAAQVEDQAATDAEDGDNPASAQTDAPAGLDEIIVTAQRRAQDIRDVPISMTVIDGEEMKERNIENLNDLDDVVPNVSIIVSPTVSFIFFRGLGSGLNRGFETSVGVFNDNMYLGRPSFFSNGFIDLGHAEILRGPQGTLFGKNTVAGALLLNSVMPNEEFGGYADYMVGEREHQRIRAAVNIPFFGDKLMVRAAFASDERDGYIYNTALDRYEGDTDNLDGQIRVRFKPTASLDINLKARLSDVHQDGNGTAELTNPDDPNIGLFEPFDPDVEAEANGQNSLDHPGFVDRETWEYMAQVDWDVSDYILTIAATHAEYEEYNESDVDFSPIPGLVAYFPEEYNQQSLELRVVSPEGKWFDFVAGAYAFRSEVEVFTQVDAVPVNLNALVVDPLLPPITQTLLTGILPDGSLFTAEQQKDWFNQITTSYALFGQGTLHLGERLDIIGGVRISFEKKELDFTQEFTNTKLFFTQAAGFEEFALRGVKKSEQDFSPKISAIFKLTDETNIYGTVAKGFKAGGFNESSATADQVEFDAETAITYEAGIKGRFLGGYSSFAIGGFWTEFNDLQTSTYNGARFIVSNAAKAVTRGIEWELGLILSEGLFIGTNGAYTDAYYRSYKDGPCTAASGEDSCDLSGKRLSPAPKWNGSAMAHYEHTFFQSVTAFIGGDAIYVSEVNSTDHDPIDAIDAYWQYNGRIGVKDPEGLWSFTVHGKNLSDEVVILGTGDSPLWTNSHFGSSLPGRTIDAEFRLNF